MDVVLSALTDRLLRIYTKIRLLVEFVGIFTVLAILSQVYRLFSRCATLLVGLLICTK